MVRQLLHRLTMAAAVAALVAALLPAATLAAPKGLPSASNAGGQTTGDLSPAWWQWAVGGWEGDCPIGMVGNVALLPGSTGGETSWTGCSVPAGTQLLFPVINFAWSEAEAGPDGDCLITIDVPDGTSLEDRLHACATAVMDTVTTATATVDGKEARPVRAHSSLFSWDVPENNPFGVPAGTTTAVADGYWLRLPSLPVGVHDVRVHGSLYLAEYDFTFTVDVAYEITVRPPGRR
jgi:hypothetical protein